MENRLIRMEYLEEFLKENEIIYSKVKLRDDLECLKVDDTLLIGRYTENFLMGTDYMFWLYDMLNAIEMKYESVGEYLVEVDRMGLNKIKPPYL